MKNKKIKIIISFCLVLITQACSDYLDVVPDNIAVIEDAFESKLSSERYLASLYDRIPKVLLRGSFPPNIDTQNPQLPASDEIWVNDNVRFSSNGDAVPVSQILTGSQNVVNPHLDAWGYSSGNNVFQGITDCNIFIKNIHLAYDLKDSERKIWIGEAKFLKAYFHFYLLRMYGPIPIARENIPVSSNLDVIRVKRDPVDEVADYIVELLDEAIASLPNIVIDVQDDSGRATRVMAGVLKARTLMLVASPLFNGNADYVSFKNLDGEPLVSTIFDQSKWERAEAACLEAITFTQEASHVLYTSIDPDPSWSDVTRVKMDIRGSVTEPWNKELLWPITDEDVYHLQASSRPRLSPRAAKNRACPGFWAPTMRIAEMFYSKNGVPINEDPSYNYSGRFNIVEKVSGHEHYVANGFDAPELNLNREPRFYASLGFDGGIWLEDQIQGKLDEAEEHTVRAKSGEFSNVNGPGGYAFSQTGYYAKKLSNPKNFQNNNHERDFTVKRYPFPIARLAGLYLLYAEALNENGKTAEAHSWIDQVRERSGLKGVVESWANYSSKPSKPNTKEGFREIVQQERMIELVFEGQRFWDLRRWKRAQEFYNQDIRGWNRFGETTEEYYQVLTFAIPKFITRDYLWPISEGDMIRNPNLVQNPGW